MASVATHHGDTEHLSHFIQTTLIDEDRGEAANLAYWAYWIGESGLELSDDFMATGRVGDWGGQRLLEHLLTRLTPGHGYLDLYVHTTWSLLTVRPALLRSVTKAASILRERTGILLDDPQTSALARRELDAIRAAVRLAEA